MKSIINHKLLERNKKISMALFIASLAVLGLGAYLAWPGQADLNRTIYSWIALMIGFILTRFSVFYMSRYGQSPRYDEVLGDALSKLRSEYTYFVYSSPLPMLLMGPCRLWLPVLVTSSGTISYEDGKWKHTGVSAFRRFMGQEALIDPEKDVEAASLELEKQFASQGIPLEQQPEIQPVVVTLLKNAKTGELKEAPYPVVSIVDLKRFIRKQDRENCATPISAEEAEKITAALTAGKMK